jgi:hypothetical protein
VPKKKTTPKPGFGRPRLSTEERQVFKLAEIQCTIPEMAAVLDISESSLTHRFAEVIKKGREAGKKSIRHAQYRRAMQGSTAMLVWLGKQWLGQVDKAEPAAATPPEKDRDPANGPDKL